jgi:hypothetical protein
VVLSDYDRVAVLSGHGRGHRLTVNRILGACGIAAVAYIAGSGAALLAWIMGGSIVGTLATGFAWFVALPSIVLRVLFPFLSDRMGLVLGPITWGIVFYVGRTPYVSRQARRTLSAD